MSFYCLLLCLVSKEKSPFVLFIVSLNLMSFSLTAFRFYWIWYSVMLLYYTHIELFKKNIYAAWVLLRLLESVY